MTSVSYFTSPNATTLVFESHPHWSPFSELTKVEEVNE